MKPAFKIVYLPYYAPQRSARVLTSFLSAILSVFH